MFPFLSNHGVLGLNARSLLYIRPFNRKKAVAFADDKLKTKAFLAARGIPVAKLYGRIETREQVRIFDFSQLPNECVLKPNYGYGGEGILILKRGKNGVFFRNGKVSMSDAELREHIEDILDGKFSLNGRRDIAFFEQILVPHSCFSRFRPVGLPDIRVIVFNLAPVMSMLRIPTANSDGKANVHLGGIGIGIDIAKGTTTHAAQYHRMIKELSHGESPAGHKIPFWDEILLICSRIQYITNIGYLAVDMTIDEHMGPVLLEVNARAGLMVQLANLAPLQSRLKRVQGLKINSPEKGVRIGQDLFGQKTKVAEKKSEEEQPVLGIHETILITLGDGTNFEIPARIASDEERTVFAPELIVDLLEKKGAEVEDEKEHTYKVKFALHGKKMQTVVAVGAMENVSERAIVGRRDLAGFLIDPTKKTETTTKTSVKTDLRAVDRQLGQIDSDLLLIKLVKPSNLEEEITRMQADKLYNPVFTYQEIPVDAEEVKKKLDIPIKDETPLGKLLEKKRKELQKRVALLQARGSAEAFTRASKELFGVPTTALLKSASNILEKRLACDLPPPKKELLTAEQAAVLFEKALEQYSLHNWQVKVRENLVARVTVGGNAVYIQSDAIFSKEDIASLIAHEIETHVLTSENGEHQPYNFLRRGCANYLDTQEGLANYNQIDVLSPFSEKMYMPARNILSLQFSLGHSLAETRAYMEEELGYTPEKALGQSIAMKRGLSDTSEPGGFTKSVVYFRGLQAIERFVKKGGDLKRLYVGKVALENLELIEGLPDLQPPLIVPVFLRNNS